MFGFRTPKKSGSMVLKAREELNRTPRSVRNTPNTKPGTPRTPRTESRTNTPSKVSRTQICNFLFFSALPSPSLIIPIQLFPIQVLTPRSGRNTPVRGILKTPTGKQRLIEPDTPLSSR